MNVMSLTFSHLKDGHPTQCSRRARALPSMGKLRLTQNDYSINMHSIDIKERMGKAHPGLRMRDMAEQVSKLFFTQSQFNNNNKTTNRKQTRSYLQSR